MWAEWIAWELELADYAVLLQAWDFVPGTHWTTQMREGISSSDRTLAVLSRAYLQSVYGQAEWQAAYRADPQGFTRKLIPIHVEDCDRPDLLGEVVAITLFNRTVEEARQALRDEIQKAVIGRGKPEIRPPFPGSPGQAVDGFSAPRQSEEAAAKFPPTFPGSFRHSFGPRPVARTGNGPIVAVPLPPSPSPTLADRLCGGADRRLRRAGKRLAGAFSDGSEGISTHTPRVYRRAMRLALRLDSETASGWFDAYDTQIPDSAYPRVFAIEDGDWLRSMIRRDRRSVLVIFELATRIGHRALQRIALDHAADVLGAERDPNLVVRQLRRWQDLRLLDLSVVTEVLSAYATHTKLSHDEHLWSAYFRFLPEQFLPDQFDVRCFLGRGTDAVRLADTEERWRAAMDCCLESVSSSRR